VECPDSLNDSSAVWTVDGKFDVAYSEDGNNKPVIDNLNWKFVAAVAIIAMAVSLLSGGLGGVPFGILILRASIGGVVFFFLAVALNLLLNRFFPELWETDAAAGESAVDGSSEVSDTPGSRVDIVLPAEQPNSSEPKDSTAEVENEVEELKEAESGEDSPLENLDRFTGAFSEDEDEMGGVKASSHRSGPAGEHDPEEIAQAIHTVIKRDEKG